MSSNDGSTVPTASVTRVETTRRTIKRVQAAARNDVLPLPGVGKEDLEAEAAHEAARKKKKQEKQYHEELQMELNGCEVAVAPVMAEDAEESVPDAIQIAQEDADMSTVLMSRKKRKLYEAMKFGQKRKKVGVELIEQRKKKLNDAQNS